MQREGEDLGKVVSKRDWRSSCSLYRKGGGRKEILGSQKGLGWGGTLKVIQFQLGSFPVPKGGS